MWSDDAALEHGSRARRFLDAAVAGIGALFAVPLFLGLFDHGLPPKPTRAEAALAAVLAAGGGPARPAAPGLCFRGHGGELLDFAPAGQHCP